MRSPKKPTSRTANHPISTEASNPVAAMSVAALTSSPSPVEHDGDDASITNTTSPPRPAGRTTAVAATATSNTRRVSPPSNGQPDDTQRRQNLNARGHRPATVQHESKPPRLAPRRSDVRSANPITQNIEQHIPETDTPTANLEKRRPARPRAGDTPRPRRTAPQEARDTRR